MNSTLNQDEEESITILITPPPPPSTSGLLLLLILNAILLTLGTGASLLLRLYFIHGGRRLWLSSLIQVCGWPLLIIPIFLSSTHQDNPRRIFLFSWPVHAASSFIGLLFGLDCFLYSYGSSYLPLSTSSLLVSTQLSFTAFFAFLIVRQRFTAYSVNAIVLLTVGPVVLGLGASKDRPESESNEKYYLGFFMTVAAAALSGLVIPLMERAYKMVKEDVSYRMVMEVQLVMGVFATGFCLLGMIVNKDFQAIPKEAREFGLGEAKYYMILISNVIFWQFVNLGLVGVITCSSSLLAGILCAVLLPVCEMLAVLFLHEKFDGSKGVALALCLWGFVSYLYGEIKQSKKLKGVLEAEVLISIQ